ncbi:hypothetical protein C0989_012296 [Termitomyces sp. Mn162]|nr:hypothetical protein C0989_012296 [Termitomyces sp. Mn162]
MPYQDSPSRMLNQQLINDLAEIRANTTIFGRDPAEEGRYRLRCPFSGTSLLWPPIYPPAPLRHDFYADRYSEESSSPSLPHPPIYPPAPLQSGPRVDRNSEELNSPPLPWPPIYPPATLQSNLYVDRCSEESSSPPLPWPPIYPPAPLQSGSHVDHNSEELNSPPLPWPPIYPPAPLQSNLYVDCYSEELSSPPLPWPPTYPPAPLQYDSSPRVIPHIIDGNNSFDPFSCDAAFEDRNARSIDTPNGRIFAPVPQIPTAAALEHFEAIALASTVPAVEDMMEEELSDSMDCDVYPGVTPTTSRNQTPLQDFSDPSSRSDQSYSVVQPIAPSAAPRIIPHIIGEEDPFNPFAYDPVIFEDETPRSIDTPNGRIFAPVPQVPTAAALERFEAMALAATLPGGEGVPKKELSMSTSEKAAPPARSTYSHTIGEDDPFNPFSYK